MAGRTTPKYFSSVCLKKGCKISFIKGKSAIMIARQFLKKDRNFVGEHFWARGYAVSTVGYELEAVKKYIREQEANDEAGRF